VRFLALEYWLRRLNDNDMFCISFCLFLVSQKITILIKICNVFAGRCQNFVDNPLQLDCDNKEDAGLLQTNFEDTALVGLDAMQRANSTLEDL
jgi:hypothetical protein